MGTHAHGQCPMCKNTLTNSSEGRALRGNINTAVVVLLAAPFVIVGLAAYSWRRARKRRPQDPKS